MRSMYQMPEQVSTSTNIAILDGQGIYGLGLRQVIQKIDGFENSDIVVFKSLVEFMDAPLSVFKVVIVDAEFKEIDSLQIIEQIHKLNKRAAIVLISDQKDENSFAKAMQLNLHAFLRKDCSASELQFALQRVTLGLKYFDSDELLQHFKNSPKKKINGKAEDIHLDETDLKMVKLIAEEYTQLEMNKILDLPTSTIMYLRRRLFAKMGVKNTAGFIRKAIHYGLID